MAVLEVLEREDGFTDIEADLARYICANADEVCRMTISDLAKASFTSNATIVRLCRKVGVKGYRDLRVELAADLEKRRSQRANVDADHPFVAGQSVDDVISSVLTLKREALDTCYASIHSGEVERVARAIRDASQVYLYGNGDSEITAMAFANLLIKVGVRAVVANQFGESSSMARTARRGDVVIAVSYSGQILDAMANVIPIYQERKCKLVLLSAAKAPMGFNYSFRIPAKESGMGKVATFYSQTCFRFILECIYSEVFELDYEANQTRKDAGEKFNPNIELRA
jgi:DNA-binding MurR/RpiR family transcriptional regulator